MEYKMALLCLAQNNRERGGMPQLLFQDRRDMKRASVGLLTCYLVDFRRTPDAKTSLRILTQRQISEVATTSKCRPLES